VYDTVEIPLNPGAPFTDRIHSIKMAVEHVRDPLESDIPFRSNLYYSQVVDLRKVDDIDAVLHLNARKTGTHKIQIIEAGKKCMSEIAATVALIVNDLPKEHSVSRVDTCADVVEGPQVRWIAQTVRARSAQWQSQFGTVELKDQEGEVMQWSEMGKREVGTMYLGKRPNCFRVYDKLSERKQAWNRERRQHERLAAKVVAENVLGPDAEGKAVDVKYWALRYPTVKKFRSELEKQLKPSAVRMFTFPDFETWFREQCKGPQSNLIEMPKVLTRVERQMGAGRIPERLNSFEKLFSKQALDFNPFDRLDFSSFDEDTKIDADDYSIVEFAAGLQFKRWLEEGMSYQHLFSLWNKKRNGKKMAKKFAPFVAAANPPNAATISSQELFEHYRDSLSRQMAA
jgi:hypothetical protein